MVVISTGAQVKVLADNAAENIYSLGYSAFPWSVEALAAIAAKKEAFNAEVKGRMDGLEIFSSGPLGSDSYASHLADKVPINLIIL